MKTALECVQGMDEHLQHMLQRPRMYARTFETLETLIWQALSLRGMFLGIEQDFQRSGAKLLIEVTGKSSGSAPYHVRLEEHYGVVSLDRDDPNNERAVGFYRSWVALVQNEQNALVSG